MRLKIFDYGDHYEWEINFKLVDGNHEQLFLRTGRMSYSNSKLDTLREAIHGLEQSLSDLVRHVEDENIIIVAEYGLGKHVKLKAKGLTNDWKVE